MKLKNTTILVVDDDTDVLTAVRLLLKTEVKEVVTEKNPENIRKQIASKSFDLIMLDMNFNTSINTGNEGLFWLKKIREMKCLAPVIMITAYGDINLAVRSLKEGADDFLVKPWHNDVLLKTIAEVLEKSKSEVPSYEINSGGNYEILGQSEPMLSIFHTIKKVGPTDANILILGENGTGKDLIAKAIHKQSRRSEKSYIKVDVGALSEGLFESELFGHKKGAFTDAREDRTGRFEAAHGGTLFLDEIGNISLYQQSKLLTVLQNRQVTRLGANEGKEIDIRLICATNVSLKELASESKFRKDLIYRINTVEIIVPPLRQRKEDILSLANHFISVYSQKYMKHSVELNHKAADKLMNYQFPGNVRELQYIIERAIIMSEGEVLEEKDLIFSPIEQIHESAVSSESKLSSIEKNTILRIIEKNSGNISKAAKELGITRTALYRRLSKYDI